MASKSYFVEICATMQKVIAQERAFIYNCGIISYKFITENIIMPNPNVEK